MPILQTFWHKYRPFTDPKMPKGLYYRPRSVNTDPLGNPANCKLFGQKMWVFQTSRPLKIPTTKKNECLKFKTPLLVGNVYH